MQHIETIQGLPVIGEKYLVRSIEVSCAWRNQKAYNEEWWTWAPILGRKHEDQKLLAVEWYHYHVDFRFLTDEQIRWYAGCDSGVLDMSLALDRMFNFAFKEDRTRGEPVYREWECLRQMPDFPVSQPHDIPPEPIMYYDFTKKLEDGLKGAKMKGMDKCLRCPHKGISMNGLPQKNGTVVCPGHGMRWNVKTGEMVSREAEAEVITHKKMIDAIQVRLYPGMDPDIRRDYDNQIAERTTALVAAQAKVKEVLGE